MAGVVGVPKEIKDLEGRVSMQPDGVVELVHHGHDVVVETGAGKESGFTAEEYDRFREGQELFTYLHLASDKQLTEFLMERKINSIAYETVELPDGSLPLLAPMSEVAGRMSVQAAAHCLESPQGGAGRDPGGGPRAPAAKVTIIGGGVVGTEAAKIALGM